MIRPSPSPVTDDEVKRVAAAIQQYHREQGKLRPSWQEAQAQARAALAASDRVVLIERAYREGWIDGNSSGYDDGVGGFVPSDNADRDWLESETRAALVPLAEEL